jgi:hypothetical protein
MANYALIACVKTKVEDETRALQLYRSPLFNKSLLHALRAKLRPYVLSAEFGLVSPDQILPPYEKTLKTMGSRAVQQWAKRTGSQLRQLLSPRDTVHLYAGQDYIKPVLPILQTIGCQIQVPIEGALGKRLALLKRLNDEEQLYVQLNEYYKLTRLLEKGEGQGTLVGSLQESKARLPARGLYQFVDPSEPAVGGLPGRVTRIGTHAVSAGAKSTLQGRINTHRGPKSGIGSHRSSILRLHVGNAIKRSAPKRWDVPTWSEGMTTAADIRAGEAKLEFEVSKYVGGHRVYWLEISDDPGPASDRAFLERNIIGLLSSANLLRRFSESGWLGESSEDFRIALSGLWNLDHLFLKPHEAFIDVYKSYVESRVSKRSPPSPDYSRWAVKGLVSVD